MLDMYDLGVGTNGLSCIFSCIFLFIVIAHYYCSFLSLRITFLIIFYYYLTCYFWLLLLKDSLKIVVLSRRCFSAFGF